MAAPSKVWVCRRSLAGIAGSIHAGSWISCECYELSGRGRHVWLIVVQRGPAECGREAWPTRGCCAMGRGSRLTVLSSVIVCSLRFHMKRSPIMKSSALVCIEHSPLPSTVSHFGQQVGVSVLQC
jgi:hypothetical protein